MSFNKTIYAPITLVGESGITVIRLSGNDAIELSLGFCSKSHAEFNPFAASELAANTLRHCYIIDNKEFIDEAVISIYKAPYSFTGEDVVELSVHGGSFIYRKVSDLLSRIGCIYAGPGEFSQRAYLNGKMDLAQAEAISDIIKSKTEAANKLALKQLTGEYSAKIKNLKEDLINYCSLLELELDFSEEGLDLVSRETLLKKLEQIINSFTRITKTYESGKIIKNGINLAIVGSPNVGKSSIFNYLLNENRAIVTDIPGTTRDYLEEPLVIDGIQFNLIDTAGIRSTEDIVEIEGVKRSKKKIQDSDIILEVEDLSANSHHNGYIDSEFISKRVKVYNKADLVTGNGVVEGIKISAKTGQNMVELQQLISQKARELIYSSNEADIIITNERHRNCLLKSCEYLVNAKKLICQDAGNELISFEIRAAMDAITEIIGKTSNVDILNNIFSKFCIGK